jgi:hypothetical protein
MIVSLIRLRWRLEEEVLADSRVAAEPAVVQTNVADAGRL